MCSVLVKTRGSEQEEKSGRVSIRDNQTYWSFKVTMEGLRQDDAGTYWCGIERSFTDPGVPVKLIIDPGKNFLFCPMKAWCLGWKNAAA